MYSMTVFSDLIFPVLELSKARNIVEIGADTGGMSSMLADYCQAHDGRLTSIDPQPRPEFREWVAANSQVQHVELLSLEAIPTLSGIDAWVIDGDHNWYTVYNEVMEAEKISRRDGKPFLAFFHDVAWPWARRDMYYAPDTIPAEFRHPYSRDDGVTLGYAGLRKGRGFTGSHIMGIATHEGGPRNGVLTAIEDFMKERLSEGREFGFAEIPGVLGLGVLFDIDAPWAGAAADLLLPFHQNKLLRLMEEDRMAASLRAHDFWQDREELKELLKQNYRVAS